MWTALEKEERSEATIAKVKKNIFKEAIALAYPLQSLSKVLLSIYKMGCLLSVTA